MNCSGQNVYVKQIAKCLAARGYLVDVFTRRDNRRLPGIVTTENGFRVIHINAGPPVFMRKEDRFQYMDRFALNTLKFCSKRSYDIVHANFWMSGLIAVHIRRLLGTPFVITFHGLGRIRRLHPQEADEFHDDRPGIEDLIVREADGIIAESPQDRDDLIQYYQAEAGKVAVIPCGFDSRELFPVDKAIARTVIGFRPDVPLVLHLGCIVPRKGIDTVLCGFARFIKKQAFSARLAIAGGPAPEPDLSLDPEIRRLREIARREGVAGSVIFTGPVIRDDLKYYFSAADVFVTTPWYEPFGMTPLESMACGTPVIGANVGGIKYTVKDSVTGYLVTANDPDAVADALFRLYSSNGHMAAMGRNAVERVHRMFEWEIVANRIVCFYKKIIEKSGCKSAARPALTAGGDAGKPWTEKGKLCNL